MALENEVKEAKKAMPTTFEVPKDIVDKLEAVRAENAQMKVEIQSLQDEIAQKQQIASNLETESASL